MADLDAGKVKAGTAVAAVLLGLSVQAALFHQVLAVREAMADLRADAKVANARQERMESDLSVVRSKVEGAVSTDELDNRIIDVMFRNGYVQEAKVQELIMRLSPYSQDRAMIIQRLERIEKALTDGG